MRLIPYERLIFNTGYTPEEIRQRLEQGVGKPRGGGFAALRKAEKPFEGTIGEHEFLFWRAIRHNNGFMPLISGKIEPGRVEAELKWHPFIRYFFPIWISLLFAIGFAVNTCKLKNAGSPCANIPFGIIALVYVMAIFFYNFYAEKAKIFLHEVVG